MDIALRATFAFFFVFLITRVVGRRELGSLEPFDLILLIVLGDLIQQGITQSDYSVTGLVVAVTTMALLTVLVSYVSYRFPRLRPVLEGEPVVIIHDGRPVERNLERERLTLDEVMAEARLQQIASLDGIKWAVLRPMVRSASSASDGSRVRRTSRRASASRIERSPLETSSPCAAGSGAAVAATSSLSISSPAEGSACGSTTRRSRRR